MLHHSLPVQSSTQCIFACGLHGHYALLQCHRQSVTVLFLLVYLMEQLYLQAQALCC